MEHKYPKHAEFERAKKERDLLAEADRDHKTLVRKLINRGLPVVDNIYINGMPNTQQKGTPSEWTYIAEYLKDENGNSTLQCRAGFTKTEIDDPWIISIPIKEIRIKKK